MRSAARRLMSSSHSALRSLCPGWSHLTPTVVQRGQGCRVWDASTSSSAAILDFTCGIGVTNTGHCHPRVVAAIQQQASQLLFGQVNCMVTQPALELAHQLQRVVPAHLHAFFFSNSGAEAVEASVKVARAATGKPNIIAMEGGFHGRTYLGMALTASKTVYRAGFSPLPGGIFFAPFPNHYRYGWSEEQAVQFALRELEQILHTQTAPTETAAVIMEPILGEGGYVPAPDAYLQGVRKICDDNNILLIMDEIQSGFGRAGDWWAHSQSGVDADILIMAKGLASGMPMSCVASRPELMSNLPVGSMGGTYGGGNAVVMAAAVATIQAIEEEGMLENSRNMGKYLVQRLKNLQAKYPAIGDVRGRGLMIGTEFSVPGSNQPDSTGMKSVHQYCLSKNLWLLTCGSGGNVIRWIPPLIVTQQDLDEALGIFEDGLAHTYGKP